MFCPKCGSRNADETKFCRACGADLSNVMAAVEGSRLISRAGNEDHIELYSSGIRKLMLAVGFMIVSMIVWRIPGDSYFWLLILMPAFPLLATGASHLVKASKLKELRGGHLEKAESLSPASPYPSLGPAADYHHGTVLPAPPPSVTEPTTRHLKKDPD